VLVAVSAMSSMEARWKASGPEYLCVCCSI
jgi:hypothetical protein